jgi:hypothetical protein
VIRFGVNVGRKQAVVGFRYPSEREPGKGDNIVREGDERRAAPCLMAVLGMPSPLQHKWDSRDAAFFIARCIKGRVVEIEVEETKMSKRSSKMSKASRRGVSVKKATPKRATSKRAVKKGKGAPGERRICSHCGERGHNARSHGPGGRLAK